MILWVVSLWISHALAGGVVTLAPSLAEVVTEILPRSEWNKIVGVADYTDFPQELSGVPSVGSFAQFSVEKVVSLKPDLILATTDGNPKDRVQRLRELGFPVVVLSTGSLAEIEESFRIVGRALGRLDTAEKVANKFAARIKALQSLWHPPMSRPSVLLQLGSDPLVVVGGRGFLAQAVELIGATNIYGNADSAYPRPSTEDAIVRKPEFIFVLTMGSNRSYFEHLVEEWQRFQSIPAVQQKKVRILPGDELARPSSRFLSGLATLQTTIFGKTGLR